MSLFGPQPDDDPESPNEADDDLLDEMFAAMCIATHVRRVFGSLDRYYAGDFDLALIGSFVIRTAHLTAHRAAALVPPASEIQVQAWRRGRMAPLSSEVRDSVAYWLLRRIPE